ncbi:MAG: hypothetical protein IPJ82_22775 [Lewinellaceae bacterium]|nr:hypothetical protein [Lewinellaceae bacterium]
MKKKLGIIVLLCIGIHLLDACCGENKPFFDYSKLLVSSELLLVTATQDTLLTLSVQPDEVEYLASNYELTVTTAAYGTSCPQPGEQGSKFKMNAVDILADKDFNDTLPAGTSLSSIFFNARSANTTDPITQNLSELEFPAPEWDFVVYTKQNPQTRPNLLHLP